MKQKPECYIVLSSNYADGGDAYTFQRKEQAIQSIREDAEVEMESLSIEGYNPIRMEHGEGHLEIYVPDSGIYFEWKVIALDALNDEQIELLWQEFADVPMDPETERMEVSFLHFPAGTHREEIWHWFDKLYSKGVYALLYGK